jgi:CBS domain-containing protein
LATAAKGWLDDPLINKGLILSSLLLDGRVVWGDTAHTVPAAYRSMRTEHPNALRLQLLNALSERSAPDRCVMYWRGAARSTSRAMR